MVVSVSPSSTKWPLFRAYLPEAQSSKHSLDKVGDRFVHLFICIYQKSHFRH